MSALISDFVFGVGLCFVLKYATILNYPRNFLCRATFFKNLLNCCLCLGFHVGFWLFFFKNFTIGGALLGAVQMSGVCFMADNVLMTLRANQK
jgi:hypothetical protein